MLELIGQNLITLNFINVLLKFLLLIDSYVHTKLASKHSLQKLKQ